jgi:hypothetical protein
MRSFALIHKKCVWDPQFLGMLSIHVDAGQASFWWPVRKTGIGPVMPEVHADGEFLK